MALLFNLGVLWLFGPDKALEFLPGYLIERALSLDNVFVIALVFSTLGAAMLASVLKTRKARRSGPSLDVSSDEDQAGSASSRLSR
ncbi:hypothetical protein [Caulobacter sp. 17J80-11]|uniref:hypothetical protein n=1 Tax=Caulobacter sp. 17J80-11 TaxID=2763502 RepID=UPI0016535B9E|nr:hypothetical protein [Caulobacter sp. 17J80-11]MBC6983252.1 hypothetical protein [Caulobacter sp. 17J80-11]